MLKAGVHFVKSFSLSMKKALFFRARMQFLKNNAFGKDTELNFFSLVCLHDAAAPQINA